MCSDTCVAWGSALVRTMMKMVSPLSSSGASSSLMCMNPVGPRSMTRCEHRLPNCTCRCGYSDGVSIVEPWVCDVQVEEACVKFACVVVVAKCVGAICAQVHVGTMYGVLIHQCARNDVAALQLVLCELVFVVVYDLDRC